MRYPSEPHSLAKWMVISIVLAAALQFMGYGLRVVAEFFKTGDAITSLYHWKLPYFGTENVVVTLVWMWLAGPILEEFLFRKCLFTLLAKHVAKGMAVVSVSLVFSLLHTEYLSSPPEWTVILLSGLVYQLLYVASGRLWVPVACHISFNLLAAVPRPPMGRTLNEWGVLGMTPKVLFVGSLSVLSFALLMGACKWLWTRSSVRDVRPSA